jgi:hypothetical protein
MNKKWFYRYDPYVEEQEFKKELKKQKLEKNMIEDNNIRCYETNDIVIDSVVSQKFMNKLFRYRLKNGMYLTYLHWGVDRIKGSIIQSPLFMKVHSKIKNIKHIYGVRFDLIGLDRFLDLLHLDEDDLKKIKIGKIYKPKEKICDYPKTLNYPAISGGIHVHIQEVTKDEKICDPDSHIIAPKRTKFYYRIERKENGGFEIIKDLIMYKI